MNNCFKQSDGELIVVFDADHVPVREFLKETVGYFREDPRLFLCQTPHFFTNPDPLERNLETFQNMPSENEMFYGIIQKGLDKWNGAFFCGSAAVIRREALKAVGGFSGITITEDCETALDLHSRGWRSDVYRQADDLRPAARDVLLVHRPALALGARHVPDLPLEEPAAQARPDASRRRFATSPTSPIGSSRSSGCRS